MPFKELYIAVQHIDGRISSQDLRLLAIEHSEITSVKEMWSSAIDPEKLRGSYIEGPLGPPVALNEHEALIVLSRDMCASKPHGKHWRRFIYTKELMHVFDTPEEKSDSEAKFDLQMQKFSDPTLDMSPQYRAEAKAFWRALMVLCQEGRRAEFKEKMANGEITIDYMAAALHLPTAYVHHLLQSNFETLTQHLIES